MSGEPAEAATPEATPAQLWLRSVLGGVVLHHYLRLIRATTIRVRRAMWMTRSALTATAIM